MQAAVSLSLLLTTIQLVTCAKFQFSFSQNFTPIPACPRNSRTAAGSEFLLRTRKGSGCVGHHDEKSAIDAGYLRGGKTFVFIHDLKGNARDDWVESAQDSLARYESEDFNAFALCWVTRISIVPFVSSDQRISAAATDLHNFLSWLQHSSLQFDMSNLHLVGLGYGAIVAGIAAKEIKRSGGHEVGRITGLDPPIVKPKFQLQPAYADFVDVIHTTGGDPVGQSLTGHAEFFVNGAQNHPGVDAGDSHEFAAFLFVNSFKGYDEYLLKRCESFEKFKAGGCGICSDDCAIMGVNIRVAKRGPTATQPRDIPRDLRGRYYTLTLADSPPSTQMFLFNMTVLSEFSGTFTAELFVNDLPWQLTEQPHQLNRIFTRVAALSHHNFPFNKMRISVVKLSSLTAKLLQVSIDVAGMILNNKRSICVRQPPVNSIFQLFDDC